MGRPGTGRNARKSPLRVARRPAARRGASPAGARTGHGALIGERGRGQRRLRGGRSGRSGARLAHRRIGRIAGRRLSRLLSGRRHRGAGAPARADRERASVSCAVAQAVVRRAGLVSAGTRTGRVEKPARGVSHEGPEPAGHQGRGAGRRRPRARRRAAHIRHEADPRRAFHADHPGGAHALFGHAAGAGGRPLCVRRRPHRYRPIGALCRRAALPGRGDRPRCGRAAGGLPPSPARAL